MLGIRMPLTATWIALRLLLVPLLYIPYRMGRSMRWAHEIDAFVKRLCFPLTEQPDDELVQDVNAQIRPGDTIPDFELEVDGKRTSLARLVEDGPLLLVPYRGNWCPYSRLHLTNLAASYDRFRAAGISVLAVTAYSRASWWRAKGVMLPMADEPTGKLFDALGIRVQLTLANLVWGKLVPHEGVFLYGRGGKLLACDARLLSSYKLGQRFLTADKILALAGAQSS